MIAEARPVTVCCLALDCRRTAKPPVDGRPFICTAHLAKCRDESLSNHVAAAYQLKVCKPWRRDHYAALERIAWDELRDQVVVKFGAKP